MLQLHQFHPAMGLLNASPFCMKAEMYLKMAGLEYKNVYEDRPNGPKGKLPFLSESGKLVPDSSAIIDYLKETRGDALDGELDSQQQGLGVAVQRMLEEHLYFALLYFRWIDDAGWDLTRQAFFSRLPPGLSLIMPPLLRSLTRTTLKRQGMGRHTAAEIEQRGRADIAALSHLMGEKLYLLGDQPSSFDACVYAFLANLQPPAADNVLAQTVSSYSNLVAYCHRMHERYLFS
ncbi:MAG: glutathione S-transferase family protein [Vulcanimicrobiota bacterium]